VSEPAVEEVQVLGRGYHQPVNQRGQQHQGQGYAEKGVKHAEQFALLGQRSDMAVSCNVSTLLTIVFPCSRFRESRRCALQWHVYVLDRVEI